MRESQHYLKGKVRTVVFAIIALCLATSAVPQKEPDVAAPAKDFIVHQLPSWLRFDMELRGRTEAQTAINYEYENTQLYELTRVRGGATVRASKDFSVYAQFQDAHALNLPLPYTATDMRDAFDLRQGYLKFGHDPFTLVAGRQELHFGDERLIGISDWSNVSRTFDVLHAIVGNEKQNRLELISGSTVKVNPTSFDRPQGGFTLHGAYGTLTTLVPHVRLEPYVLLHTLPVTSQQGLMGREILVAPGGRAIGPLPAGFHYDVEGVLERGTYVNDSIHAGAGYAKFGYTAKDLPWSPDIEAEYDYASGNSHRDPFRVSTFDQFHPSNHDVFGLLDAFGWQNIKQRRLNFEMHPDKNFYVLLQGESLHVATVMDSVYSSGGTVTVKPPAGGFLSDDIGTEFDASGGYASNYHLVYEAGMGHFWPGGLMAENNHDAPNTLAYFQLQYQFDISKIKTRK